MQMSGSWQRMSPPFPSTIILLWVPYPRLSSCLKTEAVHARAETRGRKAMKSGAGDLGFPPITCGLQAHKDAARDSLPRRPPLAHIDGELLAT